MQNVLIQQAPAASGGGVSDGDKGDITVSGSGATWTIDNDVVSNAKAANMAQATIKGRQAASGTGDPEDLTAAQVSAIIGASASDQETATSTSVVVTPGVQHRHPSAAKCWAFVTVSGGTPTLQTSFNITSITDTATGRLTITIATDFSSANWAGFMTKDESGGPAGSFEQLLTAKAAGSVELNLQTTAVGYDDPTGWNFMGFGDQ
jgi:hypothetical protein